MKTTSSDTKMSIIRPQANSADPRFAHERLSHASKRPELNLLCQRCLLVMKAARYRQRDEDSQSAAPGLERKAVRGTRPQRCMSCGEDSTLTKPRQRVLLGSKRKCQGIERHSNCRSFKD